MHKNTKKIAASAVLALGLVAGTVSTSTGAFAAPSAPAAVAFKAPTADYGTEQPPAVPANLQSVLEANLAAARVAATAGERAAQVAEAALVDGGGDPANVDQADVDAALRELVGRDVGDLVGVLDQGVLGGNDSVADLEANLAAARAAGIAGERAAALAEFLLTEAGGDPDNVDQTAVDTAVADIVGVALGDQVD